MKKTMLVIIDGKKYEAVEHQTIIEVATENSIFIPTLCYFKGMENCLGTCRVCTVKNNGRTVAACTWPIQEGDIVEVNTPELIDFRKALVEMLFVEGNHFCPSCEKSGDCDLQALAYRFRMSTSRFPFNFNNREIDMKTSPIVAMEYNRCILCKRCVEEVKTDSGENIFAFQNRGNHLEVHIDAEHGLTITPALAKKAANLCPVGAILYKGKGFDRPYGTRKYDEHPIGSEIESEQKENMHE